MTEHRLKLHIAKHIPDDSGVVGTRTVTLRERIMRKLLDRKQRVIIVVSGNPVKQIDIPETDDLMALADAVGATPREGGDAS